MPEPRIFEACKRCRWWDATDEERRETHPQVCYEHRGADGETILTGPDERCSHFRELRRGNGGLQPDVCSGCRLVEVNLSAIENQLINLARRMLEPEVQECYERVQKLANVIRYGPPRAEREKEDA